MIELLKLYHMAEQFGVTVDGFELNSRESLSLMDEEGGCYIAIDPFKLTSSRDEKEKLGHELGHCITGSFYNQYAGCDIRKKHENRADKWSIQQQIRREDLEAAVAAGHTEIWDLAEYFNVTENFMRKVICWYRNGNLAVDIF